MKFLNDKNFILFILSVIHFIVVWNCTPSINFSDVSLINATLFVVIKVVSFLLIVWFWRFIGFVLTSIKEKQVEQIQFIKYFLIYFLLNMIFLYLTYPLMITENSLVSSYVNLQYYNLTLHPSLFQFLNIAFFYHIIPLMFGVSICNSFCFSLIFSYIIINLKKNVKYGFENLLFIPFCFPFVLALNQCPQRLITCSWLFIFVVAFLFFNQKKFINDNKIVVLFSIISSFLIVARSEYIFLLALLPISLFLLKVFNTKKIIMYFFLISLMFFSYNFVVKSLSSCHYELHNLSYIYDEYILNNLKDKDIEKNSAILKKVYKKSFDVSELASTTDDFDLSGKQDVYVVISTLTKFAFKNAPHFVKNNFSLLNFSKDDIFFLDREKEIVEENWKNSEEKVYIDFSKENPRFDKITYFILNLNIEKKTSSLVRSIYNPIHCLLVLFILFVLGLFQKQYFYVLTFVIWSLIFCVTLIFMKWPVSLYFFAIIQNVWVIFFLYLSTTLSNICEKKIINE